MIKASHPKCALVLVAAVGLLSLGALLVGRGTYWITVAGVDLGYSNSSSASEITIAPGGYFYWFEAFAEREFESRQFGAGYDPLDYGDGSASFTLSVKSHYEGKVTVVAIPFWILTIITLGVFALCLRSPKTKAEQDAGGKGG
ncbi:hypothetical protein [Haloferula sp.]|uniref:hypothetical protein n=1 Tax=Haloferula sp. TaxID=2497595 RepID=UPI00329C1710